MANVIKSLRDFANGIIDESALNANDEADVLELENDEEFMQECMALCIGTILQSEIMDESAERLDEATRDAFIKVQEYMVGQGMLSESAVTISNPKINVVHLNKEAQINRLRKILILKMARKDNSKNYKKYKLGQQLKKTNMFDMDKRYGNKAAILAKKLWAKTKKSGKITAVVDSKKSGK